MHRNLTATQGECWRKLSPFCVDFTLTKRL